VQAVHGRLSKISGNYRVESTLAIKVYLHCRRSYGTLHTILIFAETKGSDLLSLNWPKPPQNVLLLKKDFSPSATDALVEFAK
jgi:hypothetical protein